VYRDYGTRIKTYAMTWKRISCLVGVATKGTRAHGSGGVTEIECVIGIIEIPAMRS